MKRILSAVIAAVIALSFTSCELLKNQANSELSQAQLTAAQKKVYDLAMSWLDRWLGGLASVSARTAAMSPEDQFIAQYRARLQGEGISEADARIGFRAARLAKSR